MFPHSLVCTSPLYKFVSIYVIFKTKTKRPFALSNFESLIEKISSEVYYWLFVQDMAILEVLTNSQRFPKKIEVKLCKSISEYLQSYIVQQQGVNKKWPANFRYGHFWQKLVWNINKYSFLFLNRNFQFWGHFLFSNM